MFGSLQKLGSYRMALAGLLAMGLSVSAFAGQSSQANGLGQSWPNAPDVSASPNWHVYVFERDGVRFIQVNDLNGTVRGAIATANGEFIALPVGADAERIDTSQQPVASSQQAPGETVYRDNAVQLQLTPQSNGDVGMRALDTTCNDPFKCGGMQ